MGMLIDLTGQRFGKLTVLRQVANMGKHTAWLCRCDCGRETKIRGSSLCAGKSKSCGRCSRKRITMGETTATEKPDCYAYLKRPGGAICSALTELECRTGECKFYAPVDKVCGECRTMECEKCLIVSHQKQAEE